MYTFLALRLVVINSTPAPIKADPGLIFKELKASALLARTQSLPAPILLVLSLSEQTVAVCSMPREPLLGDQLLQQLAVLALVLLLHLSAPALSALRLVQLSRPLRSLLHHLQPLPEQARLHHHRPRAKPLRSTVSVVVLAGLAPRLA